MKVIDKKRITPSKDHPASDLVSSKALLYAAKLAGYTHVKSDNFTIDISTYVSRLQRDAALSHSV